MAIKLNTEVSVADDKRRDEDTSPQVTYPAEYREDVCDPESITSYPLQGTQEYVKIAQWKINRVFYFLAFISVACVAAVLLDPTQVVGAAVATIWVTSVGLARYLLGNSYRHKGDGRA